MLRDEVRWEKDKVVVLYGVIGAFWGGDYHKDLVGYIQKIKPNIILDMIKKLHPYGLQGFFSKVTPLQGLRFMATFKPFGDLLSPVRKVIEHT